jgi:hypothetical protein
MTGNQLKHYNKVHYWLRKNYGIDHLLTLSEYVDWLKTQEAYDNFIEPSKCGDSKYFKYESISLYNDFLKKPLEPSMFVNTMLAPECE